METPHHSSPWFINIFFLLLFAIVIGVVSSIGTYIFMISRSTQSTSIPSVTMPYSQTSQTTLQVEQKNLEDFSFSGNVLFYKTDKILTIQPDDPECDKYTFSAPNTKAFISQKRTLFDYSG